MAGKVAAIGPVVTNGAAAVIEDGKPFVVNLTIQGVADMLFHRWNCEGVEAKGKAAKGSKAKRTDDLESYVYRDEPGFICVPGEYLRQSVIHAAKYRQDPRSPRKSAMDLYKAGVLSLTVLATVCRDKAKLKEWDYDHKCRAVIQRNAITRVRPAVRSGWTADFQILVNLPEYIRPQDLHDVITNAGRLVGLADMRPSYGRFCIVSFDIGLE